MATITTTNPATGEAITEHAVHTDAEAKEIIGSCHEAFLSWRRRSADERAQVIGAIGSALTERKSDLAALMTQEVGKLRAHSEQEVDLCAGICQYTAETGPGFLADDERELDDGKKGIVTYQPIGVVYGIQPWNFPLYQVVRYSIASLMAGNGVLLKHAENCTGSGKLIQEVYEAAGLPKGLFQVLVIDHDQSNDVIADDRVRGVTFTGSVDGGRAVAVEAAKNLKKSVMELGSNDAYLVLEDADLELAVKTCVMGRIYNNGETCVAAKRFVVVDKHYDAFVEAFTARMSDVNLGDPTDPNTKLGPIVRAELRDELHEQVTESVKKGAKVTCGGEIPDMEGFFYPATVLVDVKPGMPAYDDELFGPVASVIRAKNDEDAMRIANDSRFGLGGGILTQDASKALRMAREEFDTGMVFINGFGLATPNLPFGGVKQSGYGREHGGFGVREFVNIKAVVVKG